jgi:phosphoglycolate phosphatase
MPAFPFDLVAFDLDGTLADTAPDLAAALNHTLGRLGRPGVAPEAVRHLVGHGARTLLRKGLAASGQAHEELVEQGFPIFLEYYAANICVGTRCYPALEPAMDELASRGVALAICTNKPEPLTHALVAALGWRGRFAAIVGADPARPRKPDPLPLLQAIAQSGGGRAAFVGDSIVDAETARAAGVPFVAVSFGFSDRPVEALGADAVIDSYQQLVETLERL